MCKGLTVKKGWNALQFFLEWKLKMQKIYSKPFYIKIEPTNVCDHSCVECPSLTNRKKGFMDFDLYKEIIDFYKPYCLRNCLYGQGESILHKDIFKMIEYSEKNRCPVSLCSNFNAMDEEKIKKLLDSGLDYLIICVDGATHETHSRFRKNGDLNKVLNNISMLNNLKEKHGYKTPRVEVQTIMFDYNKDEIPTIAKMVKDLGVSIHTVRNNNNELNYNEKEDKSEVCPYLWGSSFITWDGKVCFCEVDLIGDDLILTGFDKLNSKMHYWNDTKVNYARSLFRHGKKGVKNHNIRCENCKFFPLRS